MTFDAASSLIACGKRGGTLELFPRCAKFLRSAGEAQPYVDAQTRCARAEQAARDIERELATADPAILEADKIERELMECIRQLEDQRTRPFYCFFYVCLARFAYGYKVAASRLTYVVAYEVACDVIFAMSCFRSFSLAYRSLS